MTNEHYQLMLFQFKFDILKSQKIMARVANLAISTLALLLVFTICDDYKGPSQADVIQLDPANFQDTVNNSQDPWLLQLYAPWCSHCNVLRPEWAKLATNVKGVIKVAKIDPSDNAHRPRFHDLFGLVGFPRIVMIPAGFKRDKVYDLYEGARTASAIEQWARQRMIAHKAYTVQRIVSQQTWQESCILPGSKLCVVSLLPSLLDSTQTERQVYLQIIRTIAANFRDKPISFLWAQAGDHAQFETLFNLNSGFPAVVLINSDRNIFTTLKASLTEENMESWLEEIFRQRGGRRFSRFNKEITFSTIQQEQTADATNRDQFNEEQL